MYCVNRRDILQTLFFCEKLLLTLDYLTQCDNKGSRAKKLDEASFSIGEMYLNKYIEIEQLFALVFFCCMVF